MDLYGHCCCSAGAADSEAEAAAMPAATTTAGSAAVLTASGPCCCYAAAEASAADAAAAAATTAAATGKRIHPQSFPIYPLWNAGDTAFFFCSDGKRCLPSSFEQLTSAQRLSPAKSDERHATNPCLKKLLYIFNVHAIILSILAILHCSIIKICIVNSFQPNIISHE